MATKVTWKKCVLSWLKADKPHLISRERRACLPPLAEFGWVTLEDDSGGAMVSTLNGRGSSLGPFMLARGKSSFHSSVSHVRVFLLSLLSRELDLHFLCFSPTQSVFAI